ncbi:MAG: hypothetical protein IKU01_00370 [Bacteroidales bacterium]|nr:hypothetical protein [Bacteroidales bacterium]
MIKKLAFLTVLCSTFISSIAQVDNFQQMKDSYQKEFDKMKNEYQDYVTKANAEYAEFIRKSWELYEEFANQELSMSLPKLKQIPVADKSQLTDIESNEVQYKDTENLPQISDISNINDGENNTSHSSSDNYVVRKVVTNTGVKNVNEISDFSSYVKKVASGSNVSIDFYGKKLDFKVDEKLRLKNNGIKESDVADYFEEISTMTQETSLLWKQIDDYVKEMGLNDWGYFCLLRSLSENIFADIDNRVLFNFYMLRNEGGFKVKVARGKNSNRLTLLAAIDNKKEVYSYSFFRFDEGSASQLKYYSIYGGGNSNESIYTYDYNNQDNNLKQIGLDFYRQLNMGKCDVKRVLDFKKIDSKIELPYNSSHIAYLNDVPMTVFPIYFASPISIEAQTVFNNKLNEIKQQYSAVQFIDILLNFVQTAFEYKTDEQQFGYEKYFYPEEVIAYPYSDCEDRSALFAWLVTNYTDAKVVGLQYEGHLATAVCFGENVNLEGDMFSYGGKKYYVCDPTYINASIGMTMPQFKDKMPKIIKMNN